MRYRPFGRSGVAVSAVTLVMSDKSMDRGPQGCRDLIMHALDLGVNAFHLAADDPHVAEVLGETLLGALERNLVFVSFRLGWSPGEKGKAVRDFSAEGMTAAVDTTLQRSGLQHLDLAVLDQPGSEEFPQRSLSALKALRSTGRVTLLGVAGGHDAMDAYVSTHAFDVLFTPYTLTSGWRERNRVRESMTQDMAVVAYDWYPEELTTRAKAVAYPAPPAPQKKSLLGGLLGGASEPPARPPAHNPLEGAGTYAFMHETKGWIAEDLCLGYILTEPGVSSALIEAYDVERLNRLSAVPDRDLPPALAAQVEMARFSRTG